MEGPGGEPPGTAAHRGSRGLREPPSKGLRQAAAQIGLRNPPMGLCRGVQRGSGTLGRGSATELREAPAGLSGGAQPISGNSRRDFAVGFSRATGPADGAMRRRSAGVRDAPPGIRCGAQPGSGTLRWDFEGRFSGVRDVALLRGSAGLRDPPPGLCCGAQSGSAARLRRDFALRFSRALSVGTRLRSRAPLLRSGTLL